MVIVFPERIFHLFCSTELFIAAGMFDHLSGDMKEKRRHSAGQPLHLIDALFG
jgi:hypothetical protein